MGRGPTVDGYRRVPTIFTVPYLGTPESGTFLDYTGVRAPTILSGTACLSVSLSPGSNDIDYVSVVFTIVRVYIYIYIYIYMYQLPVKSSDVGGTDVCAVRPHACHGQGVMSPHWYRGQGVRTMCAV